MKNFTRNLLKTAALVLILLGLGYVQPKYNHVYAQSDSGWIEQGQAVFLVNPMNKVGIGTTSPVYKLDVSGDLRISGSANFDSTGVFKYGLTVNSNLTLNSGSLYLVSNSGSVSLTLDRSLSAFNINRFFNIDTNNNRVGIGTTSPSSTLDVAGTITANKVNINTSAGIGAIPAGQSKVVINTSAVTNNSLIFTTLRTKIAYSLSVTSQVAGSNFTVELPAALNKEVKFNWWIVN